MCQLYRHFKTESGNFNFCFSFNTSFSSGNTNQTNKQSHIYKTSLFFNSSIKVITWSLYYSAAYQLDKGMRTYLM